jgi:glycosyltransferase involved in cell wall biosynthesis
VKVLQLIQQSQLRGAEIFACQLSLELASLGITSHVACLFEAESGLTERFPQIKFISVHGSRSRRLADIKGLINLHRTIVDGGYDLVQANAGDTLKYAALSRSLFGWKARLVFRNANKLSDFIRGPLHASFNRWLIGRCDHIISVSEYCRQDLVKFQPSVERRSTTVPIGTYITSVPRKDSHAGEPVFVNIGSFVPEKNHQFLIRLFATFVQKHGRGILKLVGDGKLRQELEVQCSRLGMLERVQFLGYQCDPWEQLHDATAMIVPSTIEGLPAVILEAMAARVPVIASAVGGIPEVIVNHETGFCIEDYEEHRYVAAMESMVGDEALRQTITTNAYHRIAENYLMPLIAGRFGSVYEKLVNVG